MAKKEDAMRLLVKFVPLIESLKGNNDIINEEQNKMLKKIERNVYNCR